jgi:hypothetical protein
MKDTRTRRTDMKVLVVAGVAADVQLNTAVAARVHSSNKQVVVGAVGVMSACNISVIVRGTLRARKSTL